MRENNKKKLEWRTQDWFWLLFLVVFISGSTFTYKKEVMNLISYTSTFVSIALAFIAIYISVREATKTDKIKDETLSTLVEIRERISQVDNKVSNIDLASINTIRDRVDQVFNNFTEKVQEHNEGEEHADTPEDKLINEKVKNRWAELSKEFKEELKDELVHYVLTMDGPVIRKKHLKIRIHINDILHIVYDHLSKKSQDGKFSFLSIFHELLNSLGEDDIDSFGAKDLKIIINDIVDQHVRMDILSVNSDGKYTFNGF